MVHHVVMLISYVPRKHAKLATCVSVEDQYTPSTLNGYIKININNVN